MAPNQMQIRIADFSRTPGPRFIKQGPFSGEAFRKQKLAPALRASERVIVDLDGTAGFGSSFLDEAFGGLIREEAFTFEELMQKLEIRASSDPSYKQEAEQALKDASVGKTLRPTATH